MLGQVPGSNLLMSALSVISKQTVMYSAYTGRTNNAAGYQIPEYAAPVALQGSLQAASRNMYQQLGLDLNKNYMVFYTPKNMMDTNRNVSGDKFTFQGRTYQCESLTPWFGIDGWVGVICIDIGAA